MTQAQTIRDLPDKLQGKYAKGEISINQVAKEACAALRDASAFVETRLTDLAEANALYGKDQRLSAPDKIARNDREISWLKDLRSLIVSSVTRPHQPGAA